MHIDISIHPGYLKSGLGKTQVVFRNKMWIKHWLFQPKEAILIENVHVSGSKSVTLRP
jgi:hypothetical protein